MNGGGAEGEKESQADSPAEEWRRGLNPRTLTEIMTLGEIKSQTLNQQSHPGAPHMFIFLKPNSVLQPMHAFDEV